MRRTKEQAAETRNDILIAALQIFSTKGFSRTSLEDIAQEAGVTRGAIYWNFKNKQDVYVCLLREYFNEHIHRLLKNRNNNRSSVNALEEMRLYMKMYFTILVENNSVQRFLEVLRYKTEVKSEIIEILEVQQEIDLILKEEIKMIIIKGGKDGSIQDKVPVDILTVATLSYLNGLEDSWLIQPSAFPVEKIGELIDIFIDGVLRKELVHIPK